MPKRFGETTALVTGGSGFIGSNLCRRLLNDGLNVICVDNNFSSSKSNIFDLMENKKFEFVRHDITFPLYCEVDQIYNLACPASPIHYQRDPVQTTKTCVHGAINILGLAKRVGAKVLQASTSEVYGDPTEHPQKETYLGNVNPLGVRACYDEAKRCAESLFFDYHRQYGVEIKIARIFNTYGPYMNQNDGRVISNLIVQSLSGEEVTIYGEGRQSRSFCFVDDLVEGLIRLMNSDESCIVVNLGNPEEITVLELARLIGQKIPTGGPLSHKKLPEDDPRRRCPDISLAIQHLDWRPQVALNDGLDKTIEYFKKCLTC